MAANRGIVVEVIGDDRSALRMWERQIAATDTAGKAYKKVALSAEESAAAQVAAALKATKAQEANIASLRALAASSAAGSREQVAATVLADAATAKLARSQGLAVASTTRFSAATKEGERDLNKIVRGGLAGSGAFAALGRSLAFASSGFIAFAAGATLIRTSIDAARELAIAQRQVNQQLRVSGKSWDVYGEQIDKATLRLSHLSGFTHVELLRSFGFAARATGEVGKSLRLVGIAADVARGRGISLQAATIALTKAVGGSSTALRRLGIIVPKTAKGMDAINFVAVKFAGQAEAGASAADRFHAVLVDTEEIIGQALLPTLNRYVNRLGEWLAKMNESGRLQKDINDVVSTAGDVFHTLGSVIGVVDKATGSFANTLKVLLAFRFTQVVLGTWIPALTSLAAKWGLVTGAAEAAGAAQTGALAEGAAGGTAARAGAGGLAAAGLSTASLAAIIAAVVAIIEKNPQFNEARSSIRDKLGRFGFLVADFPEALRGLVKRTRDASDALHFLATGEQPNQHPFLPTSFVQGFGGQLQLLPIQGLAPGFPPPPQLGGRGGAGGAPTVFKSFTDPIFNQVAQARAALTKSNQDDVAAAKQEIQIIKRMIAAGHLKGASLVQALNAEAQAIGVVQSAEADAAQKRAAAVQRAAERFARLVDPLGLEVELLRFEAAGKSTLPVLRKLLAAARNALAQAKGLKQQQQALQQIVSIQQQIKDSTTQATVQFQVPAKLAFKLAKDTALGRSTTKDLLAIRKAILRFIATHKNNLRALTDAYHQLADINQQIGATAQSALGLFRQQSTRALTEGLGLTQAQRAELRARLSQRGPHGTVPGQGVGAGGFAIDPDTGRPIHVHTRIDIDGRKVAENTTKHQQRRRRRNSAQRRGPNAGG